MNCNSCRYELSQCLDGRLPSGRRGLVMQHVDTCDACGSFWGELQAAQKLVLQLPREKVSEGFREQLWERIRAGEGTPECVFREPVPLAAKFRYALTGAAAAAAALLCATWLRNAPAQPTEHVARIADDVAPGVGRANGVDRMGVGVAMSHGDMIRLDDTPLISATRRLTSDVVALEAAKQLEQRYASAHVALQRLDDQETDAGAVDRVFEDASEFLAFGELLLEMRERKRLVFVDPDVDTDLRVAVRLLAQNGLRKRSLDTARDVVGPALQSNRLASISSMISLVPLNPREDRDVLVRLNNQRPDVFPKLFFVFGTNDAANDLAVFRSGSAFVLDDPCGPSWVAPRSEVEARDNWLRVLRAHANPDHQPVQVQIQFQPTSR